MRLTFIHFDPKKGTNLINLSTPAHQANNGVDPLPNDKSIRIEILEPDVKELLSSCALYNLDQVRSDHKSIQNFKEFFKSKPFSRRLVIWTVERFLKRSVMLRLF
jgi:hypothetical protein